MRRRSGFTLVEVLVAMALTLFIMSILSAAFVAATSAVSDLKAAGDLAEKLRGAANVLKRDLEAPHFNGGGNTRLSTLWSAGANSPPPAAGFFRIYQGAQAVDEGGDLETVPPGGIHSYRQTTTSMNYSITLPGGSKRSDYLSATIPANSPLLIPNPVYNPPNPVYPYPDWYYQDTPGTFNSQSAEVAVFLVATGDQTDGTGTGPALPLYALYRRQFLPVPLPGWPPPPIPPSPAITVPAGLASSYMEMSIVPNPGENPASPNLTFNTLADLTRPVRRFWMDRSAVNKAAGVFPTAAQPPAGRYADMGEVPSTAASKSADLLLTDVVSFDVRILVQGMSNFVDLCDPSLNQYFSGNPAFNQTTGPIAFDTWTNQDDPLTGTSYSTTWNNPWQPVVPPATAPPAATTSTIPLYQTLGAHPQVLNIQAIQIVLRVWDFKTKKTRQVTMVQQM